MAGLGGKVRVVTKDGKLENGALNIISADLTNVFKSKDDKKIVCGVVHLNIKKGLANVHSMVFETGGISVVGTGSAKLSNETLKMRVDPRSKKANIATVAMIPVNISGPLPSRSGPWTWVQRLATWPQVSPGQQAQFPPSDYRSCLRRRPRKRS